MSEVDCDAVRQKACEIVKLGEGMRTEEFFTAMAIASGQMFKVMCPPETLRGTLQWYFNEVAKVACRPDEERTH